MTILTLDQAKKFIDRYKGYEEKEEKIEDKEEIKNLLIDLSNIIKNNDISAGLLLMAYNLDRLEEINKVKYNKEKG